MEIEVVRGMHLRDRWVARFSCVWRDEGRERFALFPPRFLGSMFYREGGSWDRVRSSGFPQRRVFWNLRNIAEVRYRQGGGSKVVARYFQWARPEVVREMFLSWEREEGVTEGYISFFERASASGANLRFYPLVVEHNRATGEGVIYLKPYLYRRYEFCLLSCLLVDLWDSGILKVDEGTLRRMSFVLSVFAEVVMRGLGIVDYSDKAYWKLDYESKDFGKVPLFLDFSAWGSGVFLSFYVFDEGVMVGSSEFGEEGAWDLDRAVSLFREKVEPLAEGR